MSFAVFDQTIKRDMTSHYLEYTSGDIFIVISDLKNNILFDSSVYKDAS